MNTINGAEAAAALRSKNRKTLELPYAKVTIEITALIPEDFIEARGEIDIPTGPLNSADAKKVIRRALIDPALQTKYVSFLLIRGVLNPRVVSNEKEELSDNEVYVRDFGADSSFVVFEILKLSGLAGEEVEAMSSFREEETEEPIDDRSNREEIRKVPE